MIRISPSIALDESELQMTFVRSSGPGGQNVNKVATAVQLRFHVPSSPSLPEEVRQRLMQIAANRISSDGDLIISAQRFRTQEQNRQDAIERLVELVRRATRRPTPRLATKPTRASKQRRLDQKLHRGGVKRTRRPVGQGDD
jgi:ribosome-associated protein